MVYLNLSEDVSSVGSPKNNYAPVFSRFFSALLDYFILAPVVSFFIVMFFRESVQTITRVQSTQSNLIILQLGVFAVLLFTGLQTAFIYFSGATPGQTFLKLYVSFDQKPSNLFFQIWFRQIGFVLSTAFLGLPFLAIIYHRKHRTFYDRFGECDILSRIPSEENVVIDTTRPLSAFAIYETDKKYLSTGVSALMCFMSLIFVFSMLQSHEVLLHKIQMAGVATLPTKKCFVIENQNQEERLKTALALNILNLTSDDCTLTEADEVFNHMKIGEAKPSDSSNVSLAYFVKYYIGQKTADHGMNKDEYFKMACGQAAKADVCTVLEDRNVASDDGKTKAVSPQILKNKLLDYFGKVK